MKTSYKKLLLSTVAGRTALLIGIAAGQVPRDELEHHTLQDNEPRKYRKPVVVENLRFDSITEAARWLRCARPELWKKSRAGVARDDHGVIRNLSKRIANYCNADTVEGYYWSE